MNPFEMTVLIVAIVMIARVMTARYRAIGRVRDTDADMIARPDPGADPDADRLRGEVRRLNERIAVLERIVTDGDRNRAVALEREIEQLRDGPAARDR